MYGLWLYKELRTEYGFAKVEVFRKGYTASAIEIEALVGNSLNLALENLDTITAPIGKSVCTFEIYNTGQVDYDDLFTPDATAYKVVVSTKMEGGEYNTRWSGYITPDFFAENLTYKAPISISARDNIGYLNDVDFDLEVTTITIRELIQAAFARIADDYPMQLAFVTQKQTSEGVLAIDATISTMLFKESTWYEALETILHDLGLQMRWMDNNTIAVLDISQIADGGYWQRVRLADDSMLMTADGQYFNSKIAVFEDQDFNFINLSGYREILPAWRELKQAQDYGIIDNFFKGQIKDSDLAFARPEEVDCNWWQNTTSTTMKYYAPRNWITFGDALTIKYSEYVHYRELSETEKNRIYFTGIEKEPTNLAGKYMAWRQPVYQSYNAMQITFKAFNSIQAVSPYSLPGLPVLWNFGPHYPGTAQFGLKVNILLHSGLKTYILNYNWEELNGDETSAMNFVFPELSSGATEEECTINISNIPYDGEIELRIYGWYFIKATNWSAMPLNAVSYITDVVYTYDTSGVVTGRSTKVNIGPAHNIRESIDYKFGQVPQSGGGINTFAGGLYTADGKEMYGFQRNERGANYPLLEIVGREMIHFNKKNYIKLSGTIKNLAKEPLSFNKQFVYKGKNYAPFAYSLNVISNEINITSMQEVEPYVDEVFTEEASATTYSRASVRNGNNTPSQYSQPQLVSIEERLTALEEENARLKVEIEQLKTL